MLASVTHTLSVNLENLTLTGTAAINGTGNAKDNVIIGNVAANTLSGTRRQRQPDRRRRQRHAVRGQRQRHAGWRHRRRQHGRRLGNDTYIVDNVGDVAAEVAGGTDTVLASVSYTLSTNLENLTLTGSAATNGTGNAKGNVITGNTNNNILSGLAGNDTLIGGSGNDRLDGGTGADSMDGGFGNDTYIVDNVGDIAAEVAGGIDTVLASVSYTLSTNLENLTLTGTAINGTGNAKDNVIIGTAANNALSGLDGNDTLIGGAGNDTLTGGDGNDRLDGGTGVDSLDGGLGNDTYIVDNVGDVAGEVAGGVDTVLASVTYTLSTNLENLTLTGTATISGTGNAKDNVITGNGANNFLFGQAGSDTLIGGSGNDWLDGGTDADSLDGGLGNDTYVVDNVGDIAGEVAGGIDTWASVTYTLSTNLENLTQFGVAAINATGNAKDNVIFANGANNVLTGLGGNNSLNGGSGNDTLDGGSGNDTLNGGSGADSMDGGTGNDTYIVDNVGDIAAEVASGIDTVEASVSYTLSVNLENLTLTGAAAINGTGNAKGNVITGNDNNNVLSGLNGNDTLNGAGGGDNLDGGIGADSMNGGTGDDVYTVDNAGDVVSEAGGSGFDTVLSSVSFTCPPTWRT